jgi:hypothetical protein
MRALIRNEWTTPVPVPLVRRIAMWRRGFNGYQTVFYDFRRFGTQPYLTDYARFVRMRRVDAATRHVINNKLSFHHFMQRWPGSAPRLFGVVERGRFQPDLAADGLADVLDLARLHGAIVLKGVRGLGGKKVLVLRAAEKRFAVNGRPCSAPEVRTTVGGLSGYLVTEYVHQAEYSHLINPGAVNTMRIVTLRDAESGETFVGPSVHRFGSSDSGAVDNWDARGLCADIDLASGILSDACSSPKSGALHWFDRHPDTGAAIEGVRIPHWDRIKARVLEWADELPFIDYCGWDVALDRSGEIRVLEGNCPPGGDLMQIKRPLLPSARIRTFYRRHGVVD